MSGAQQRPREISKQNVSARQLLIPCFWDAAEFGVNAVGGSCSIGYQGRDRQNRGLIDRTARSQKPQQRQKWPIHETDRSVDGFISRRYVRGSSVCRAHSRGADGEQTRARARTEPVRDPPVQRNDNIALLHRCLTAKATLADTVQLIPPNQKKKKKVVCFCYVLSEIQQLRHILSTKSNWLY